jgi:hypothetical protein
VGSAALRQDQEFDMTNIAARHEGGQKYLQNSPPATAPTSDRVHVLGDSTLCFGQGQVDMDTSFRRAAEAAKEFSVGFYQHRKGGDLGHLANMALSVLGKELAEKRGEPPPTCLGPKRTNRTYCPAAE